MKKVQHINYLGIILYLVILGLAVICILSPIFCIMPKFYAICVMISGAFTVLGMFYNRRVLWDTLKYTIEIPEEGDFKPEEEPETEPEKEPETEPVVEEKPKKAPKKKGGK